MKRTANANWQGSGKEGKGHLSTASNVLDKTPYNFSSRFEEGKGTNPEELIAAAHAGCFTMKLSFALNAAGFVADNIDTKCVVTLDPSKSEITLSHLTVSATIPEISDEKFQEIVKDAELNCPISKLYKCEIKADASLVK